MSQSPPSDATPIILIIDDNPVNLRVLSDQLLQRGFMVVVAQDGEEGLERARLVKPDLILLDVMMPGINGLEACRRLKASDATCEIPVIFKTSLTDTATRIAGFEAGGVDFVTSPIQIEEVMARVHTHVTLHTVQRRLEQARAELEDRVEQRTAELRAEVAERKRAEDAQRRLNRELQAISSCNQTLLRATDEQTLIDEICRIICDEARYRMAWVGYAQEDDAKTVRPVAWSGLEDGYLEGADIRWSEDHERGRGPTGTAIRTGETCYAQDFTTDTTMAPWRENALQRGYRSTIALPLKNEDAKTFGTLTIYSSEPNAFSPKEIRLLEELAGDLAFGICVIRARAERDEAEKTLALRSFALNSVHESALLIDEHGRFLDVNEECCRALGYSREQLLQMSVPDIDPGMSAERWPDHWADLKAERSLIFERLFRSKDGRSVEVEVNANYFEYGGVGYNLALARDVSERKRAERKLKQSEERLRLSLEAARIGIFDWDLKTDVWYASPTYYAMLGYEPRVFGDWITWAEGFHPEDRARVVQLFDDARAGLRSEFEYEARIGHADGSYRWIHTVAFGIERDSNGKVNRVLGLQMDITERKHAEEEKAKLQEHLHHAQKMEAIGQLAGGVAHDFNNILAIVNGYSDMLLKVHNLSEAQREPVEEILAAGQRGAALTRQLLAFSRKLLLQPKVFNLNSVIDGFDKMLRRLIGDEIEVRTELDPNLKAVSADPNQMEQVLLNFCVNARDAMPNGGRITIETANVDVNDSTAAAHLFIIKDGHFACPICGGEVQLGSYVMLSVSDTGIGMDQETISHIFEPFFTTKGPERGTGLGLATVFGITKQSGGHVLVDSAPGKGATFRLYLPAISQQVEQREQISTPEELLRGTETVLLVEDAAPLRSLYRKILEDKGYTVLEAGDGERAIQVAEQYETNLALLLTDVSLPKIKGPDVAKILLQQRPKMKVLFMSGHTDEIVTGPDHLLLAGSSFIQKPFSAEDLFRRMREILDPHEPEKAT